MSTAVLEELQNETPKSKVSITNSALIVVDMQNDFIDPEGALYLGAKGNARQLSYVVNNVIKTINLFKKQGESVYALQDLHVANDREFDRFPPHCIWNTWGYNIYFRVEDALRYAHATTVDKFGFDGSLELWREMAQGSIITDIYLTGVTTDICVFFTAIGLTDYFSSSMIHIVKDSILESGFRWGNTALEMLKNLYGIDIIDSLTK